MEWKQWELHAELGEGGHSVVVTKSQNAFAVSDKPPLPKPPGVDGRLELSIVTRRSCFRWRAGGGGWREGGGQWAVEFSLPAAAGHN